MEEKQSEPEKQEKKRRRWALPLLLLAVLCLGVFIGGTGIHILDRQGASPPVPPPDVLPEVEERSLPIPEEQGGEAEGEGPDGGSVNLTFSDRVTVSLSDREARLYFVTPARSDRSMVLELLIRDHVILRTGALSPGSKLERLPLLGGATLQPGGYDGEFRLTFYDPDTGQPASLNAAIPVEVTVAETFEE